MFSTIVSDYPLPWLALCAALAAAMAAAAYFRNKRLQELGPWKTKLLAALRFLSMMAASMLLLNIFVRRTATREEKPLLVIAADNSESMLMRGPGAQDSLAAVKARIAAMKEALDEKYSVKTFAFGDKVRPISIESLDFSDKYSDMSQMIDYMQQALHGAQTGALVVVSDGIFNRGQDPVYTAPSLGKKIHTLLVGDTSACRDLQVSGAACNETAFIGNEFPVHISVSARMLKGCSTVCEISRNGKTEFSQNISITSSNFSQEIDATLKASSKGLCKYTISLRQADGEITLHNNTRDILVDVIDDKRKVLILSAMPHPDVAAVRNALASGRSMDIHVATAQQMSGKIDGCDLAVLVQVPSLAGAESSILDAIKEKRIPALYILGQQSDFTKFSQTSTCLQVSPGGSSFDDAMFAESAMFSLLAFDSGAEEMLSKAPPLSCAFGDYMLKPQAQAFGHQVIKGVPTSKPIIAVSGQQGCREAVIAGEGIWRWRIDCFRRYLSHEKFDLLITRLCQYLIDSGKQKERLSVAMRSAFSESEPVCVNAKVMGSGNELDSEADVEAEIAMSGKSETITRKMERTGSGYYLRVDKLLPGSYTCTIKARSQEDTFTKTCAFTVSEVNAEAGSLVANSGAMLRLSALTGGQAFGLGGLDSLEAALLGDGAMVPVAYSDVTTSPLLGLKWMFWLIVLLISAEWFLRKFWGSI